MRFQFSIELYFIDQKWLTTVFGILYTHSASGGSKARGQEAKNNGWIEKAKMIPPTSSFKLLSN